MTFDDEFSDVLFTESPTRTQRRRDNRKRAAVLILLASAVAIPWLYLFAEWCGVTR